MLKNVQYSVKCNEIVSRDISPHGDELGNGWTSIVYLCDAYMYIYMYAEYLDSRG